MTAPVTTVTIWYEPTQAAFAFGQCVCSEPSAGSTVYFNGLHRVRRYQCADHLPAEGRSYVYELGGAS